MVLHGLLVGKMFIIFMLIDYSNRFPSGNGVSDSTSQDRSSSPTGDASAMDPDPPGKIDPKVLRALDYHLNGLWEMVINHYALFVSHLCTCVKNKGISAEDLRTYVLRLPAFTPGFCKQNSSELVVKKKSKVVKKLEKADCINKIFDLIGEEHASFLNCGVFLKIQERFCSDVKCKELNYSDCLKEYLEKLKIEEFYSKYPPLKALKDGDSKIIQLKLDIEHTKKISKIIDIEHAIAAILGIDPLTLRLVDIGKGCVVVTFLIPAFVADIIFAPDRKCTSRQAENFRGVSILWLKCGKYTFFKDEGFYKVRLQLILRLSRKHPEVYCVYCCTGVCQ